MEKKLNNSKKFLEEFGFTINEPKKIYHYTNPIGLLGILLNKTLWTSDIRYLNDMDEFNYASTLIIKRINSYIKDLGDITKKISNIIRRKNIFKNYQIYVCSFSEEGNLLSQWRAYSPDFNGFSIGFDFNTIKRLASNKNQVKYFLYPCIYDKNIQKKIIDNMVKIFFETLIKILETNNQQEKVIENFLVQYMIISSSIKNNSFKEEKEWRLIGIRKKNEIIKNKYRANKSMIIPYIEFNFSNVNPIKEIYIGPSPHIKLAENSLLDILNQEKIKADVIQSKIPYRNW